MATISKRIDMNEGLTQKQIEMLVEAEKSAPVYDPENPPLTGEELVRFKRVSEAIRNEQLSKRKQNVTLRLPPRTIEKAKALGKGYTSILSRIVEKALDNPELTEMLLR